MTGECLLARAKALGFDRAEIFAPVRAPRLRVHRLNENLVDDARERMPGARAVIALLRGYLPYRQAAEDGRGAMISAYYPASQAAYEACGQLAREIAAEGFRAIPNAPIAIKPFLMRCGIGRAGANSLVSVAGLGTRFHAQILLTDMPLPAREAPPAADAFYPDEACAGCQRCVRACPVNAIGEGGYVDIDRCLRARGEGEIVPEALRPLYGNRLLGCDICQDVCPRNARDAFSDMPIALSRALSLDRLLSGEGKALSAFIGKNYARRTRIRMKAALVAGNLRRADALVYLDDMAKNGAEGERAYALWAIKCIKGG